MVPQADIKGDIYEGLLQKSAAESPKGAAQYFAPRELKLVPNTGCLCVMYLYLHGLDDAKVTSGQDSLAQDPGERYSMVLTNPPFGKKSSVSIANDLRPDR